MNHPNRTWEVRCSFAPIWELQRKSTVWGCLICLMPGLGLAWFGVAARWPIDFAIPVVEPLAAYQARAAACSCKLFQLSWWGHATLMAMDQSKFVPGHGNPLPPLKSNSLSAQRLQRHVAEFARGDVYVRSAGWETWVMRKCSRSHKTVEGQPKRFWPRLRAGLVWDAKRVTNA